MRLKRACRSLAEEDEQRNAAGPRPRPSRRPAGLNTTPAATEIPPFKATIVSVRLAPNRG